jgi:hypothetical protein
LSSTGPQIARELRGRCRSSEKPQRSHAQWARRNIRVSIAIVNDLMICLARHSRIRSSPPRKRSSKTGRSSVQAAGLAATYTAFEDRPNVDRGLQPSAYYRHRHLSAQSIRLAAACSPSRSVVILAANDHARPGHPTVPSTRLAKPDAAAVSWTDHDVESNRYDWAGCSAFRQQDWSLPVQPPTPGNPITWRQTVMLGQDVLPFRQRDWPLPPLHALPPIDL